MPEIKKPGKKYKAKRPTRDEFELEELGERLSEAKEEESEVLLAIWDSEPVRGKIVEMDARTKMVHVQMHGELLKVPFLDIMQVNNADKTCLLDSVYQNQSIGGNYLKAFILDRDGVINQSGNINSKNDFVLLPGVPDAIRLMNEYGYDVFVASNQGGVGLGYMTEQSLNEINEHMLQLIGEGGGHIKEVKVCTCKPRSRCNCRKPKPGMLNYLIKKYDLQREMCFMVGDRDSDIEAGQNARVKTILITDSQPRGTYPDFCFKSLLEAVIELKRLDILDT